MPQVVGGDALTCELMRTTQAHMSNSISLADKLIGPVPAVGQFHLQVKLKYFELNNKLY